jgi:oligosaccharide repeat unit polymerase
VIGSLYVAIIGQANYLVAFLTVPLINLLLLPITKRGEKFDPTHPVLLILVSLMIGTVLRSFFIVSPLQSDTKFLMLLGEQPTILLKGIFAIYLGFICFLIGYAFPVKPLPDWSRKKIFHNEISYKKLIPVAVVFTVISVLVASVFFKKMGVDFSDVSSVSQKRHYQVEEGSYSALGYYRLFMDIVEPIFYMFVMYFIQTKKSIWSFLGVFTIFLGILNMAYPFIVSSRSQALYVLINAGLIIYFLKGGIPWRQLFIVIAIGSLALVIMTSLRETHSKVRSQTEVSTNPLVIMVTSLNFLGVDKTSHIINGIPDKMPYQFGESLFLWVVAPIPRTMWPDKPDITYGRVIGEKIYGKRDENSPGGGVPPGYIAELYLNFGYLGIIAGMFLFGVCCKLFYDAFKKVRSQSIYGMILYLLVFVPTALKLIGGDFSANIVKIFTSTIPVFIIMKLVQYANKEHVITSDVAPARG